MKRLNKFVRTGVLFLSLAPIFCTAQIKPGLWEITGKIQGANNLPAQGQGSAGMTPEMLANMQAQIAALPPERRKSMEIAIEAMKNMSVTKDGNAAMKVCVTKEMIETQQFLNQDGKCAHVKSPLVGSTQKFTFKCTDPVSTGEGVVKYQGDTSYSGVLNVKSNQNGKPVEFSVENTGKFLEANCGSVKPMPIVTK
jgi:hypothetical protein